MKTLCKIFGHNYKYYLIEGSPIKNVRFCKRCNHAQEWKIVPGTLDKWVWMHLVGRTKKGAKEFLKKISRR
jgi:hypothetical protein